MLRYTNMNLTHNLSPGFLLAAATLPVELLDNSAKLELFIPISGPPIGYLCTFQTKCWQVRVVQFGLR